MPILPVLAYTIPRALDEEASKRWGLNVLPWYLTHDQLIKKQKVFRWLRIVAMFTTRTHCLVDRVKDFLVLVECRRIGLWTGYIFCLTSWFLWRILSAISKECAIIWNRAYLSFNFDRLFSAHSNCWRWLYNILLVIRSSQFMFLE